MVKAYRGYLRYTLDRKAMTIHQLLAIVFIPNPDNKPFVDHKDRNKQNNLINNLRWVTEQENQFNKSSKINGTSKYVGVCWVNNKGWRALVSLNRKQTFLGYFKTPELASAAYQEAKKTLHVLV